MNPLQQLWAQLYADKKKFTLICGLLAVGLLLWGRLLLNRVPRTAVAEPASAVKAEADPAPPPRDALSYVAGSTVVLKPRPLDRNLFAADPAVYGSDAPRPSEPTKSLATSTDRQLQLEAVRRAAGSLTLQSVIAGREPRVMINGRVLKIGQSIDGFQLISMGRRHAVLEKNGIKIRLGM